MCRNSRWRQIQWSNGPLKYPWNILCHRKNQKTISQRCTGTGTLRGWGEHSCDLCWQTAGNQKGWWHLKGCHSQGTEAYAHFSALISNIALPASHLEIWYSTTLWGGKILNCLEFSFRSLNLKENLKMKINLS